MDTHSRLLCLVFVTAFAQAPAAEPLRLEQIFGPAAVRASPSPSLRWMGEDRYTTLEKSSTVPGGRDLVAHDVPTGKAAVLIDASALTPAGATQPIVPGDHQWSRDRRKVLLSVAASEARRNDPLADAWVYDLAARRLQRLGGDNAGRLLYAEFSPDGNWVAYVAGNNLFAESLGSKSIRRLTTDGNELILNGRGDIAHEEEFSLGKAFSWSPDSKRLAYWRFDTQGVGVFTLIRNTEGQYSKTVPLRYPKPGTTNSAVRVGSVSVDRAETTWFALPDDPRQNYVPRMDWAPDGREVLLQYENRPQNTNRVFLADATTGALQPLLEERESTWLLPSDHVHWLDGGRAFTWLSERDGWHHLYVVSRDGRMDLRTPGDYDVVNVESVETRAGYAYFTASPDNVTQRYLYRATLSGKPRVERLTPAAQAGTHGYDLSPGAKFATHTYSRADVPPVIDLVRLPSHSRVRVLADNGPLRGLLAATSSMKTDFLKVDIGDVVLDAWLMKPPDFDASRRYPLLLYVYSEPAGQTVADRWGGDRQLWHWMLAQRGYVVASVDSRGAASPRGRAWRRSVYGQIGILASADQAAAVQKLLAQNRWLDPDRVGVWGWSGGGAMTLNALFRHPDLYAAGIAVASPVDQMLYNSIYQERYMGLPSSNPDGYRNGSPINFADRLAGDLLIIHGTGDDNVHYQNAEQLVNKLVEANKPFEFMAYPDRTHGIGEGVNTRLHLYTLATRFLDEHLLKRTPRN